MKYKVRYNLGRGTRYMMWQVKCDDSVEHYDPAKVTVVMHTCKLVNRRTEAIAIFEGGYKRVCSWVECEDVEVFDTPVTRGMKDDELKYNPRVLPYWNIDGEDVDGKEFDLIYSDKRKLYTTDGNN